MFEVCMSLVDKSTQYVDMSFQDYLGSYTEKEKQIYSLYVCNMRTFSAEYMLFLTIMTSFCRAVTRGE